MKKIRIIHSKISEFKNTNELIKVLYLSYNNKVNSRNCNWLDVIKR